MSNQTNCCSTTEDGSPICLVGENGEKGTCGSQATLVQQIPIVKTDEFSLWEKVRSVAAFSLACVTSPCCTPLIIPLVMGLAAGSPFALWMSLNLGWVYGGLTLVSVLSFIMAVRWMNKPKAQKPVHHIQLSSIPVNRGEKAHG